MKNKIVKSARSYIGTKFCMHARVKNVGVDCLGLLMGIAKEVGAKSKLGGKLSDYDHLNYPKLPKSDLLTQQLDKHLIKTKKISKGSIIIFKFNNLPQHIGITTDFGFVHAYAQSKKVVETRLDEVWGERVVAVYKL